MVLKVFQLAFALLAVVGIMAALARVFQRLLESSGILELMNTVFYRLRSLFWRHKNGGVTR